LLALLVRQVPLATKVHLVHLVHKDLLELKVLMVY
jgi:hypothetical protein